MSHDMTQEQMDAIRFQMLPRAHKVLIRQTRGMDLVKERRLIMKKESRLSARIRNFIMRGEIS
jgi:hypothetical protein